MSDADTAKPFTLLFIDDEANILSSLKRLFRPHGYRILTAESGPAGLELLGNDPQGVDVVVSDMRMPGMSGAEVLEQVRAKSPDTARILLTGYADISSTIAAINRGEIYRYIAKPWNDEEIVTTVRDALERKQLKAEKIRLEALTQQQNEELKNLNASLEEKVRQRTAELRKAMDQLTTTHEKLKKNFFTSIQVFANLLEMREASMAGHSRRVAEISRGVAKRLNLSPAEIQDLVVAALLHDIGKIGLPDYMLAKPFNSLTSEERIEYMRHPAKGAAALMALDQLAGAAALIRAHHERYDGQGYPARLSGLNIPLGARILALASDYDALQSGRMASKKHSKADALAFVLEGRGSRYDPSVVDAFVGYVGSLHERDEDHGPETLVTTGQLHEGMVLSRDVTTRDGLLLLARGFVLDASLIEQVRAFEKTDGHHLTLYVRPPQGETKAG